MTRPEGANTLFRDAFPAELAAQLEFVECPLMRIVSLQRQNSMEQDAVAIFTSSNGVRFAPPAMNRTAYCVGARTTENARLAGWNAQCAGRCAEELIDHLTQIEPRAPMYHFSGVHVRGDVAERLTAHGLLAARVALYDQELLPLSSRAAELLATKDPAIVALFSPRAAAHFAEIAPESENLFLIAISAAVADAARDIRCRMTIVAVEPTADAMIESIEKLARKLRLG